MSAQGPEEQLLREVTLGEGSTPAGRNMGKPKREQSMDQPQSPSVYDLITECQFTRSWFKARGHSMKSLKHHGMLLKLKSIYTTKLILDIKSDNYPGNRPDTAFYHKPVLCKLLHLSSTTTKKTYFFLVH